MHQKTLMQSRYDCPAAFKRSGTEELVKKEAPVNTPSK
jgi:hypothetical protein